jgi:hypothetical protein
VGPAGFFGVMAVGVGATVLAAMKLDPSDSDEIHPGLMKTTIACAVLLGIGVTIDFAGRGSQQRHTVGAKTARCIEPLHSHGHATFGGHACAGLERSRQACDEWARSSSRSARGVTPTIARNSAMRCA